ncbi:CinA family nicotinamide mononucleotide deamidase-related protein [Rhabdobacter roseus]|uniref:CinA-like protein n=1 Tax=Rhabdobacter roseus TaxID=1655419 RepID=A0A840TJV5_9BACT|nr:competence/damage-inducible protein A [Rhabdobacter roseus]MBB5283215.1 nicotinamide-nucleotide amidase [Rhabdobacter roseus]
MTHLSSTIRAEVLTIGDEILFGQITDTNTQWIGTELTNLGIRPVRKTSVGDNAADILSALHEASLRAELIIITGGLGPTKDDITKQTLCRFFDTVLELNQEALEMVSSFFIKRGREMTELNRQQAALPANCTYLANDWGTAPGMWFERDGRVFVSLPGVPFEMKNLMQQRVLPRLRAYFQTPVITHRIIRTIGIGESFLAEKIEAWEDSLPAHIRLAYLPSFGGVRLRLTGTGALAEPLLAELNAEVARVLPLINDYVYGYDDDEIETVVGRMLVEQNATLSTAESCTGGLVAHRITSVPGSSRYFEGAVVSYSNAIKTGTLGVSPSSLEQFGAVSEQVVKEMAEGARALLGTTYALATSGIAGPDGGTEEKPVGTVWIACATPHETVTRLLRLGKYRDQNVQLTTTYVLDLLRKTLRQPVFNA